MTGKSHHYAFDAATLLLRCADHLRETIEQDYQGRHQALHEMNDALIKVERNLHEYLTHVLEVERDHGPAMDHSQQKPNNITRTMASLEELLHAKHRREQGQAQEQINMRKAKFWNPQDPVPNQSTSIGNARSGTDTLLFRLIVTLELCLVRIDDAYLVITGHRRTTVKNDPVRSSKMLEISVLSIAGLGAAAAYFSIRKRVDKISHTNSRLFLLSVFKTGGALVMGQWLNSQLKRLWMTDKIWRSTQDVEEWIKQWKTIQATSSSQDLRHYSEKFPHIPETPIEELVLDSKSKRLIEYALKNSPKSTFWHSQGEIRFMMLKRFMDVYYASVGTAIDAHQTSTWQLPLVAGAAASFYSITGTGASEKASKVINTASKDLIQHAWGMVSLPAVKSLMLKASKILKGASVADRIEICGVSCFVLSREPAPELAAALKRQYRSRALVSSMSTITESEEHTHENDTSRAKKFAGSSGRFRQRDVIFHLTGGGFFAHTIASDLPYLLDWSASTGAVIICPEYALLPEHKFPVALEEISAVYKALVNGGTVTQLGFEVNKIVVTGESAGGNLAASLCVKLGLETLASDGAAGESAESLETTSEPTRMPDALMLSCAALNLSLELSHSRVIGTQDPVLPSGLISAISDAYASDIPGVSKHSPLVSPVYAPDCILRQFPPVLLFAGSNDPLLDDSVLFNERLRCLDVASELRATHHMPHAYWGLGTAGFPEALDVQHQCQEWLSNQFHSNCNSRQT